MSPHAVTVVVASFRPHPILEAALRRLIPQCEAAQADLIVARRPRAGDDELAELYPGCTVVPCGPEAGLPQIRGTGLAAALGHWVVLTEDNVVPATGWLWRLTQSMSEDVDVLGGEMGNSSRRRAVDWGAFFAEYGFFGSGKLEGQQALMTGANVAYHRRVLDRVTAWSLGGAWENVIHERLHGMGARFRQVPGAVMDQQLTYRLGPFAVDRWEHGRDYARVRSASMTVAGRVAHTALAPILPLVLAHRIWRSTGHRAPREFVRALPAMLTFLGAWSAGEAAGYLQGASPDA